MIDFVIPNSSRSKSYRIDGLLLCKLVKIGVSKWICLILQVDTGGYFEDKIGEKALLASCNNVWSQWVRMRIKHIPKNY